MQPVALQLTLFRVVFTITVSLTTDLSEFLLQEGDLPHIKAQKRPRNAWRS